MMYGFRRLFRLGPVRLDWIGSWDHPAFGRFGVWRNGRGVTFRYRGWLLIVVRP